MPTSCRCSSACAWTARPNSSPRGIRVNAISAGVVETGALEFFPNREEMLAMGRMNPAGRLVTPEDVAACTTFLCSPDAEMIIGQTIVIDGGGGLILVAQPDVASAAPGDDA